MMTMQNDPRNPDFMGGQAQGPQGQTQGQGQGQGPRPQAGMHNHMHAHAYGHAHPHVHPGYGPQPGYGQAPQGGYGPAHGFDHHPGHGPAAGPQVPNAPWIDFRDERFVKGLLVGAAATFLLTNEGVQKGAIRSMVRLWGFLQGGVEEMKERFRDAEAELQAEQSDQ
jgi:hypothetical protein